MSRPRLEPGDILLLKGRGPISWSIRLFTRSSYSHAMLYLGVWLDQPWIIEAGMGGVDVQPLDRKPTHQIDAFRVQAPSTYRRQTTSVAMDYLGDRYGYGEILGFALALTLGLRQNPVDNPHALFCSELINQLYLKHWSSSHDLVSPSTLAKSQHIQYLAPVVRTEVMRHDSS